MTFQKRQPPSEAICRGIATRYANGEIIATLASDWETRQRTLRDWISPYVEIRQRGTNITPIGDQHGPEADRC